MFVEYLKKDSDVESSDGRGREQSEGKCGVHAILASC